MPRLAWFASEALYVAADKARRLRNMSWNEVARETGIGASTFTCLGHGHTVSTHTFAALVVWAKLDANDFVREV